MYKRFVDEVFDELAEEYDAEYEEELFEDSAESYEEEELFDEYFEPDPSRWPQWPSRSGVFKPQPGTIPVGPPKTFSPCQAINDDFTRLSLAVGDLKNQLRQSPSNLRLLRNRSDVVRSLSRQILARLQSGWYVQRGCTRQDMKLFASSVNAMRGGGADSDTGSWPRASSPRAQEPRRAARESLRHLLNWIRQAERRFPRI